MNALIPIRGARIQHGRVLRTGQIWQSNDPRRLRAIQIMGFEFPGGADASYYLAAVRAKNVVTGTITFILAKNFTVGARGWSLLKDVRFVGNQTQRMANARMRNAA